MKIVIGVMAVSEAHERKFFGLLWNNREALDHEIFLVAIGEKTLSREERITREASCLKFHAKFLPIENDSPRFAFLEYAKHKESELCFIFPQGTYIYAPGFISRTIYFFQRNKNVGMVGYKPINGRGFDDGAACWLESPSVIEEPHGPFAIRTETMAQLDYVDGNDWGVQLSLLGHYSFRLPWPPIFNEVHLHEPFPAVRKPESLVFWMNKAGEEKSVIL